MPDVDLNELERYLRIYQENPDSRVFAPLADMYRRLGKFREAEQICREGLQRHPYYAGGKVALGYVLLDTGRLDEAHQEIETVVTYYPDNLLARKILVRILAGRGDSDRARREYETLRQLAPQVAQDPELTAALEGPPRFALTLDKSPFLPPPPRGRPQPLEMSEKTEMDPDSHSAETLSAYKRAQRKAQLYRKKLLLETWLQVLGSSGNLR